MRLPRDISGQNLAKALGRLGYTQSRRTGSHMRLTTQIEGEHHHLTRDQLIQMLDL